MSGGYRIAIVGATGLVGQTLLRVLTDQGVPVQSLVPLARESGSRTVTFREKTWMVEPLDEMDWSRVDVAFFAAGNAVSERYAPTAVAAGVTVIDKSSRFRMDDQVPLVVPEVNGDDVGEARLIASPNCSTIQLVVALAPVFRTYGLDRVVVSTYQAVSGTGREAVDELDRELEEQRSGRVPVPEVYPVPIADNVLPYCDAFGEADFTGEEWKLMRESSKILGQPLKLSATAVRVPVRVGHAESVYVETASRWTLSEIREVLQRAPSVTLMDDPRRGIVPTPLDVAGHDRVLVGRIRRDPHHPLGLHLFIVADNLRRGAATNAIDIMRGLKSRWGVEEASDL